MGRTTPRSHHRTRGPYIHVSCETPFVSPSFCSSAATKFEGGAAGRINSSDGGGGGGTGGFLFDSADLLEAVSAIRSPNRSDFLPVEGDWGMIHVSMEMSRGRVQYLFFHFVSSVQVLLN